MHRRATADHFSAPPVRAEPIIEVGSIELVYGMGDQKVPFFVTSGDPVNVLNSLIQEPRL